MAFNFPSSPTVGQVANGYIWNGTAWVGNGNLATLAPPSDTAPSNPVNGQLWWESDTGILWLWYVDANTSQWVQLEGPGIGDAPSDGNTYERRNGVWRLAPVEMLAARTVNAATTYVEFDVPTGFTSFQLRYRQIMGTNTAGYPGVQFRIGGVWRTSGYFWVMQYASTSSNVNWNQTSSGAVDSSIFLSSSNFASSTVFTGVLDIQQGETGLYASVSGVTQNSYVTNHLSGLPTQTGTLDGVRFVSTIGDISRVRAELYGFRGV